jgi:outer membrane protein assembly factor BamB
MKKLAHHTLEKIYSPKLVTFYYPNKTFDGYTLLLHMSRFPVLVGMEGNIVHYWPDIVGAGRIRLTREGHLLGICPDNFIRKYNWDGELIWEFFNENTHDFPHHDLIYLKNNHVLIIYADKDKNADYLLEISREGEVIWEWHSIQYIDRYFKDKITQQTDLTHINSLQELPANRWYDAGDSRFKPGNILVSARNLNTIFVVDKETKDVVWQYDDDLDYQHEARMIKKGYPGEGNILLFNNGYNNLNDYKRSSILEINPSSNRVEWEYSSKYFFSPVGGAEQEMPNGNIVITSSQGGRIFEVNRKGEIVWQIVLPYLPGRPGRYPYDYCKQFEKLPKAKNESIAPRNEYAFIDYKLYQFERRSEDIQEREINGDTKRLLGLTGDCRPLMIPPGATLRIGYGVDSDRWTDTDAQDKTAIFRVKLYREGSDEEIVLINESVNVSPNTQWFEKFFELHDYEYDTVYLYLDIEQDDSHLESGQNSWAYWEVPSITSKYFRPPKKANIEPTLTPREIEIRKQKLKALGYVD